MTESYRQPTPQEIAELGLIKERGYTRCSDPQCGDSTWDHDCDDQPQTRWKTRWVAGHQ